MRKIIIFMTMTIISCCLSCMSKNIASVELNKKWSRLVIPLPHEMSVSGSIKVPVNRIEIKPCRSGASPSLTAFSLLKSLNNSTAKNPLVRISMGLVKEYPGLAELLKKRLMSLPNKDQAYVIKRQLKNSILISDILLSI